MVLCNGRSGAGDVIACGAEIAVSGAKQPATSCKGHQWIRRWKLGSGTGSGDAIYWHM